MAERYTDRIRAYCESQGVEVPAGFGRHAANRYVAIDVAHEPPRLIAATWFKQQDLLYYATRLAAGRRLRLLDFKDGRELTLTADGRLQVAGSLPGS